MPDQFFAWARALTARGSSLSITINVGDLAGRQVCFSPIAGRVGTHLRDDTEGSGEKQANFALNANQIDLSYIFIRQKTKLSKLNFAQMMY